MATLDGCGYALEINYLGCIDEGRILVAEVGLLCGGSPVFDDCLIKREFSRNPGFFDVWQDGPDEIIPIVRDCAERVAAGQLAAATDADLNLLIVPGARYPFLVGEGGRYGVVLDAENPEFTVIAQPGFATGLGSEISGIGPMLHLPTRRDDLLRFARDLQEELRFALEIDVDRKPKDVRP